MGNETVLINLAGEYSMALSTKLNGREVEVELVDRNNCDMRFTLKENIPFEGAIDLQEFIARIASEFTGWDIVVTYLSSGER